MRDYARLLLPEWGFGRPASWATHEGPVEGFPDGPRQPLAAIRRIVQVYATRLRHLRAAVLQRREGPPAPRAGRRPTLTALLPEGPLRAAALRAPSITDETDEGSETTAVEIDETIDMRARPACPR